VYKLYPSLVLGFHGCDEKVAEKILANKETLQPSEKEYDWLGHGSYFWENSPERAMEWAKDRKRRGSISKPAVLGAVIALGRCLDLIEAHSLRLLQEHHDAMQETYRVAGKEDQIPRNRRAKGSKDLLNRQLDCAVIEYMHSQIKEQYENGSKIPPFDSARGAFFEGDELYSTSGFKEKNHIQICVRNPNCIKGFFRPRDLDKKHSTV
jgi:hypothetical protein